jgi:hypothetical protein
VRLKIKRGSDLVPYHAFYNSKRREMRDCFTCALKGHMKLECPSFVTPEKGRGGCTYVIGRYRGIGDGRGGGQYR